MSDKILIVDDDREIRDVLRVLLTGERFEVAEASSGEEALAYLAEHPGGVDLVILDVMMEGISGYHVCLQLREQWNVPVLFLTAKSQESDLTMGYSSGGDDYLVKPFSREKMPASRMCQGVWKSGSPMPREMPPSMPWSRSKYFRMPEGWMSCTRRHMILP